MQAGNRETAKFLLFSSSPGKGLGIRVRPFPQGDSAGALVFIPPHVSLAHLHPHGAAPGEGN